MIHQLMYPKEEYVQCVDRCQKLNTSTKAGYGTQLPYALIIELTKHFKYIDGISKKFIPNFSTDEEISLLDDTLVLFSVPFDSFWQ